MDGIFVLYCLFQWTILEGTNSVVFLSLSPHVRKFLTVLDSGLQAVDSGFQVLDSSLFQRILIVSVHSLSCILDSIAQGPVSRNARQLLGPK